MGNDMAKTAEYLPQKPRLLLQGTTSGIKISNAYNFRLDRVASLAMTFCGKYMGR